MSVYRNLLAVDPSLTCSGWVLLGVEKGLVLSAGKIKGQAPSFPMAERLRVLQQDIEALFSDLRLSPLDVLVCEAATTVKDPHNALKVEQVRSMFESVARARGVVVPGRVNPRSVHYEIMGLRGKQMPRHEVKATARKTVAYLYGEELAKIGLAGNETELERHQDIVDALLIGRLALIRINSAREASLSIESLFQTNERARNRSWRMKSCGT